MPFLSRPDGAQIHYSVKGSGIPVLLIAPGGMRSCIANWAQQPYDPLTALPASRFCLIGMDQRSAQVDGGQSSAKIQAGDGWHTFMEDQIALLDHLGIQRCHLLGSCIGPSYQLRLLKEFPHRFGAAVLMQPIGLSAHTTEPVQPWEDLNWDATSHWFGDWAVRMERSELAGRAELRALHDAMFGGGKDFVFSVAREDVKAIGAPLLVLMGRDMYHPSQTAREIAQLAPNAELIQEWRDMGPERLAAAAERIEDFLARHSSGMQPAAI